MNEIANRTPEIIATEINVIKAQARDVYVRSAIEIGRRLYEAKAMVSYGKWGEWLKNNVDYSERTAQNLMAVYEEYGRNGDSQAIAGLSFTQAVLLLRLDGETRAELMEQKDVPSMSTRELEEEIRKANEEIEKRQLTIDQLMAQENEKTAEMEADLQSERAANGAMREELKRAKTEASAAYTQASDAVKRANTVAEENTKLKAELEAEKARNTPETIVEQVEVVPAEVEDELRRLREQVKTAPDKDVILLRAAYSRMVAQLDEVEKMLDALAVDQPEEAAKYRRAVAAAAARMAERLGGV